MQLKYVRAPLAAAMLFASTATYAQSPRSAEAAPPAPPPMMKTQPPKADADMQAVLDAHAALGPKPIETLTPAQARLQPTPADAVKSVMRKQGRSDAPDPSVTTQDLSYGGDPKQFARIYRPAGAPSGPLPVIVYYHGGGWVIANVDVYDATPRSLSKQLNALVVSVEYRAAPEAKFPAQHDDAATAYGWVLANAASWGGDPKRVALAGESAGGNLAINTAIAARDKGMAMPVHILSVYPIANSSMVLPSRRDSANAKPLNAAMLPWFGYYYSRTKADMMDPRVNLVRANLRGLPPVTVVNAQIDPLRSDGDTLVAALKRAGNRVEQRTYAGATHEFFGMATVVRDAYDAQGYAVSKLKTAFGM